MSRSNIEEQIFDDIAPFQSVCVVSSGDTYWREKQRKDAMILFVIFMTTESTITLLCQDMFVAMNRIKLCTYQYKYEIK